MKTTNSPKARKSAKAPNSRKAAIRNSDNWLDALDLPSDPPLPRVYPSRKRVRSVDIDVSEFSVPGFMAKNKAELWAESLPDLAIMARRRELHERTEAPAPVVVDETPIGPIVPLPPMPRHRSALSEAGRNAGFFGLAVALLATLAACVHML